MKFNFKKYEEEYSNASHDFILDNYIINNKSCEIIYDDQRDIIYITFWNDFHGDVDAVIETNNFKSFYDNHQEQREFFVDNWDYARETVYQTYGQMDWDVFLSDYAGDYIGEFVEDQIKENNSKIIKRPLFDRINRYITELIYNLKNKNQ